MFFYTGMVDIHAFDILLSTWLTLSLIFNKLRAI